jgi:HlyD family secretion protein
VGDQVKAGQVLGEMDPVDLDDRVRSQESVFKRAEAVCARPKPGKPTRKPRRAATSKLFRGALGQRGIRHHQAAGTADRRCRAIRRAGRPCPGTLRPRRLVAQRSNLRLIAPVDGVVVVARCRSRHDHRRRPGGGGSDRPQDPCGSMCASTRSAHRGLGGCLRRSLLRSRGGQPVERPRAAGGAQGRRGHRGTLAKVTSITNQSLAAVGELAEVTVDLPALPAAPVIPNAAVQREGDKSGVWQIVDGDLRFCRSSSGRPTSMVTCRCAKGSSR